MAKGKKMYSKSFIQAQITELAKVAGLKDMTLMGIPHDLTEEEYKYTLDILIKKIAKVAHSIKTSKNKKEKVVLTKKQFCAGIQFLKMLYNPYLDNLNPDTQEAEDLMNFIDGMDRIIKLYWALMGDDSKINVPFKIPDFGE